MNSEIWLRSACERAGEGAAFYFDRLELCGMGLGSLLAHDDRVAGVEPPHKWLAESAREQLVEWLGGVR